jgi:hypothetical protein
MKILPNTQRLGKLTFDSNQVRKSKTNPNVLIAKASDGKDYGVVRKSDGSYDFAGSSRNATFGDRMATASANPNIGTRLLDTAGLLMSEPQRMMTRALTNNRYNNPEEVVADSKLPDGMLKNTLGFAAGMLADPFNAVGAGAGTKAAKLAMMLPAIPGLNKLFKSSKAATNVLSSTRNLEDLKEATNFAKKYGYELPENLDRIAQSDMLTDRTVRGLMNRHNTFVRGVSTNWDEIGRKNPEILKQLESKGFNLSTPEGSKSAAEYMATHIPGETGYGRFGLREGENALYLSNSAPTAEGYTYGKGFLTKVKKPTDYSSTNRTDWIKNNDFKAYFGFKNSPYGEGIVKNDYVKRFPTTLRETLAITGDPNKFTDLQKVVQEKEKVYNQLSNDAWQKNSDLISDLKYKTDAKAREYSLSDQPFIRDKPNLADKLKLKYLEGKKDLTNKYYDALPYVDIAKGVYSDPDVWKSFGKNLFGKLDPFSHYAIKGNPNEKVVDLISSKEITPDTWQNTSRAHVNKYSNKLSRKEYGGKLNNNSQKQLLPLLNKF